MNRSDDASLLRYLEKASAGFLARKNQLRLQGRTDESNLEQIKANVCDICQRIWRAGADLHGSDQEGLARFFREKLTSLAGQWDDAYQSAVSHEDPEQILIEGIKLAQIEAIRQEFECRGREL